MEAGRHAQIRLGRIDRFDGLAKRRARRQVERKRHHRELPLVIQRKRSRAGIKSRKRTQRNLLAARRAHIDVLQSGGILLELWVHLHHHVILIQLGEDGGDLALAEGVVERIVDVGREHAEARSGVAVDDQRRQQTEILLVARDVPNLRQRLQPLDEA